MFLEPAGGCPALLGTERDYVRGQVSDIVELGAVIFVGPVRCANDGLATTEQVLPQLDLDLAPGQTRFYLTRLTGEDDFGQGLVNGFALARITGASVPCP